MEKKVKQLEDKGWAVIERGIREINSRWYKYAVMECNGRRVIVNHQGGLFGFISRSINP